MMRRNDWNDRHPFTQVCSSKHRPDSGTNVPMTRITYVHTKVHTLLFGTRHIFALSYRQHKALDPKILPSVSYVPKQRELSVANFLLTDVILMKSQYGTE